jgi:hypothetical protein
MYRVSEEVRTTHGQDGATVLDKRNGRILRLNRTASLILERLQQGQTDAEIIEGIRREFRVSSEVVESDLSELMKSMERIGLIHNDCRGTLR